MYPLVFRFLYGIVQFVGVLILYYYLLELAPMQYLYADLFVVVRPPNHTTPLQLHPPKDSTLMYQPPPKPAHYIPFPSPINCPDPLPLPPSLLASCRL